MILAVFGRFSLFCTLRPGVLLSIRIRAGHTCVSLAPRCVTRSIYQKCHTKTVCDAYARATTTIALRVKEAIRADVRSVGHAPWG